LYMLIWFLCREKAVEPVNDLALARKQRAEVFCTS
jgi:hypothetical protein